MSNPQQPELARSRKTPAQDPDSAAAVIEGERGLGSDAPRGPVPPENQPGHHPPEEQDKPDLDAFAERLGVTGASAPEPAPIAAVKRSPAAGAAVVAVVVLLLGVVLGRRRRRARRRRR